MLTNHSHGLFMKVRMRLEKLYKCQWDVSAGENLGKLMFF